MANRAGVIRTAAVTRRTLLPLLLRFHVVTRRSNEATTTLADEVQLLAFESAPEEAVWLDRSGAETLLSATPDDNVLPDLARDFLHKVVTASAPLLEHVAAFEKERETALLQAHRRVREAAQLKHVQHRVEFVPPIGWLGVHVLLPRAATSGSAIR